MARAKKAPLEPEVTSESIEDQIQAFIQAGGEIEQIKTGVSGQQSMAPNKHITLGNKSTRR